MGAFCMTERVDSKGVRHCDVSDRYMEITQLPDGEISGTGAYYRNGRVISQFTFTGDDQGVGTCFECRQNNGRSAFLTLRNCEATGWPLGMVWTIPEYPKFQCVFGLAGHPEGKVQEIKSNLALVTDDSPTCSSDFTDVKQSRKWTKNFKPRCASRKEQMDVLKQDTVKFARQADESPTESEEWGSGFDNQSPKLKRVFYEQNTVDFDTESYTYI